MYQSPNHFSEVARQQRREIPPLSIVIPSYNEAANLPVLLQELINLMATLSCPWEILVVDDGSNDSTDAVMFGWARMPGIRYIKLSRNFGKEAALTAGLSRAGGDIVILIDADLQHPVALIPQMLEKWQQGYDCVSAVRETRKDDTFLKRLGTAILYRFMNMGSSVKIPDNAGDFRLLDRSVVTALMTLPERNRFMKGLYAWVGFNHASIPFTMHKRANGKSSFSLDRLFSLGLTGLTAFSYLPLRIWSGIGAMIAILAFTYGTYVVLEKIFYGNDIPGWPTVVAGIMFFNGILLLSIGILGEYIGRIYEEVKRRPLYIIAGEIGTGLVSQTNTVAAENRSATTVSG